jgi:hypothetical protein
VTVNATEAAVAATLEEASRAGERIVTIARVVVGPVIAVSATWYWSGVDVDHLAARMAITYGALALAVGFSVAALLGGLRAVRLRLLTHLSVTVDVVVAFLVLLPVSL